MQNLIDELINFKGELGSNTLAKEIIRELLFATGDFQELLFQNARKVRTENQINYCMLRGVIEISNYCQKNCSYCAMRVTNKLVNRYRMTTNEILEIAKNIADRGITTFFVQSGQDPAMDRIIQEIIPILKEKFNDIILCIGERPSQVYEKFYSLGASCYILKFETSDLHLYRDITKSNGIRRRQCIDQLKQTGFKIGVGNIIGLPHQTIDSIINDLLLALEIRPDFVSVAPFIPNQNTPLEKFPHGDFNLTLNWLAISRLLLQRCFIPSVSALEKIQKDGQLMGLNAGANVMTINFTPPDYRKKYSIYSKQRYVVKFDHAVSTASRAKLNVILN
jgi:biotin synthase